MWPIQIIQYLRCFFELTSWWLILPFKVRKLKIGIRSILDNSFPYKKCTFCRINVFKSIPNNHWSSFLQSKTDILSFPDPSKYIYNWIIIKSDNKNDTCITYIRFISFYTIKILSSLLDCIVLARYK